MPTINTGHTAASTVTNSPPLPARASKAGNGTAGATPAPRKAVAKASGAADSATPVKGAPVPAAAKRGPGRPPGTRNAPDTEKLQWTREQRAALVLARKSGNSSAESIARVLAADPLFAGQTHLLTPDRIRRVIQAMTRGLRKKGHDAAADLLSLGRSSDLDDIAALLVGNGSGPLTGQTAGADDDLDGDELVEVGAVLDGYAAIEYDE